MDETKVEMLKRIRDDVETVLHNPTGVSAQALTDLRDRLTAEIGPGEDESEEEEEASTAEG